MDVFRPSALILLLFQCDACQFKHLKFTLNCGIILSVRERKRKEGKKRILSTLTVNEHLSTGTHKIKTKQFSECKVRKTGSIRSTDFKSLSNSMNWIVFRHTSRGRERETETGKHRCHITKTLIDKSKYEKISSFIWFGCCVICIVWIVYVNVYCWIRWLPFTLDSCFFFFFFCSKHPNNRKFGMCFYALRKMFQYVLSFVSVCVFGLFMHHITINWRFN